MARAYTVIRDAIRTAANTAGGIHELMLGTPGTNVTYPDPDEYSGVGTKVYDRGTVWDTDLIPAILQQIGAHLDGFYPAWCQVDTKGTGVTPTYKESFGFDTGTSITKDEANDRITLTFSSAYTNSYLYVGGFALTGSPGHIYPFSIGTTSIVVEFYDEPAGNKYDINDKTVMVLVLGKR
jgi:hypothetical protein